MGKWLGLGAVEIKRNDQIMHLLKSQRQQYLLVLDMREREERNLRLLQKFWPVQLERYKMFLPSTEEEGSGMGGSGRSKENWFGS